MSLATLEKRLDAAEIQLTPKEWAIRLADEMRKHPSEAEFFKAEAQGTQEDSQVMRPFDALADQVQERHPGNCPEDSQAKRALYAKLHDEYDTLKLLLLEVNKVTRVEGRVLGLRALLRSATIPAGPTAGRADAVHREMMRAWRKEAVSVLGDIFTHQAAVQIVQDRHFNGHAVLFQDVEALLAHAVGIMQTVVGEFEALREMAEADWAKARKRQRGGGEESETVPAIDLEAVRAGIDGGRATALAERWFRTAKRECALAGMDDTARAASSWQWLREEYGGSA